MLTTRSPALVGRHVGGHVGWQLHSVLDHEGFNVLHGHLTGISERDADLLQTTQSASRV